jgi:threonine/homoserine/homoserine lactone efflux protein
MYRVENSVAGGRGGRQTAGMDLVTNLPAFLVAVVIVSATPGPAVALIVRRTALRGLAYGLATVAGLELGIYAWALLVASGFAVVAASQLGYLVLKVVGCAVLGWLAVRSLRAWWRQRRDPTDLPPPNTDTGQDRGRLWAFGEGVLIQLANPKAPVFLLALYFQFVPADRPLFATTAILAVIQVVLETVIYVTLAVGVARAGRWFRRSVVRRRLEALTGTVMAGLGLRLALSRQ